MFEELQPFEPELVWILVISVIIAFLLAFSVGANDVSNSFGTSVGAKVLTVTQACILATFFEVAGSTTLGYSVCDKIRRSIYDVSKYDGQQKLLMLGSLACIIGSATWNLIATALKMPISGTHSIIGAGIGFTIVLQGFNGVEWGRLYPIVLSWFISPFLAGAISSMIYAIIHVLILNKKDSIKNGLKVLPYFYGFAIFVNVGSIVIQTRGDDSWYVKLLIPLVVSGATIAAVALCLVPRLKAEIDDDERRFKARQHRVSKPPGGPKVTIEQTKFSAEIELTDGHVNPVFEPDAKAPVPSPEICLDPNKLMDDGTPKDASESQVQQQQQKEEGPQVVTTADAEKSEEMVEIDLSAETSKGSSDKSAPTGDKVVVIDDAGENKSKDNDKFQFEPSKTMAIDNNNNNNIAKLFASLQIMTACFASFAHGTNDVSNAVAPLVPIWNIYSTGFEDTSQQTPVWILVFGGIGICTGLWAWGRSVMETVGDELTKLTPAKGFSIELGAAMSVLFATNLGMPISTTHCKVGSVVIVGLVSSRFLSPRRNANQTFAKQHSSPNQGLNEDVEEEKAVDWKLFGNIAITWIVTVPLAAMSSAMIMLILEKCVTV